MLDQPAAVATAPTLSVGRTPDAARFALRGPASGVDLPREPCRATVSGDRAALWLGPDEWLLLTTGTDGPVWRAVLDQALAGTPHALVEISDRQLGLRVQGAQAADLLNVFCPLDLRAGRFPPGACTRTVFAKCEIVLWHRAPGDYHVEVWRSFMPYVEGLLHESRVEFDREHSPSQLAQA